jgi:hypothetical protein
VVTVFEIIALGFIVLPHAPTENLWRDAASIFTYSANVWECIMTMLPTRGFGLFVGSALAWAVKSGMAEWSPGRHFAKFGEYHGRWCLAIMVLWLVLLRAAPLNHFELNRLSILGGTTGDLTLDGIRRPACHQRNRLYRIPVIADAPNAVQRDPAA